MAQRPLVGPNLLIIEASLSHSHTLHSVGLLWMSNQPDAETSTWQHTTVSTDKNPCTGGIRIHSSSKRAAADAFDRAATGIGRPVMYSNND